MERLIIKTGRAISMLLIALSLSLAILLIIQSIFTPFHAVSGDSMSPQINSGDAVVLKDLQAAEIGAGDVVVFRDPERREQFIIHRVLRTEQSGGSLMLATKGDNNPSSDPYMVSPGEVVGGVAFRVPAFGGFLEFLSTPRGYVSCIAIPAALALFLAFALAMAEKFEAKREVKQEVFYPYPTGDFHPQSTR